MSQATQVLFPVGRLVQGSLYKGQDKDQQGNPLVIKTGPNKGQPTIKYFFAVAYAKTGEGHWAHTEWGKMIWATGHSAFPQGQAQAPTFAWKVEDGDSAIPNKMGRKNCDREGFPGNWIVNFSSSFAPKVFSSAGDPILESEAVKLGYFVEVLGTVLGNEQQTNPGVYINHNMVALRGYGAEIRTGPDPKAVGFGKSAMPTGSSTVPVGTAAMPASVAPPAAAGPGSAPPPPASTAPPTAAVPPPTAVQPSASFIAPPPVGAAPPPPPAAGPQLTAKANGQTYAAFVAAGWTDALLKQHGYMA